MNSGFQSNEGWTVTDLWYERNGIHYPRTTAVLKHTLYNPALEAWRLRVGFDQSEQIKNDAAIRGTNVHDILKKLARDEKIEIPKEYENHANQFAKFREHYAPKFIATERTLFSEKHVFATTGDAIATIEGLASKPLAVEYKTSKDLYPSHFYQAAAEAKLVEENGIEVDGALLVLIRPTEYRIHFMEKQEVEKYFNRFLGFLDHFREFVLG